MTFGLHWLHVFSYCTALSAGYNLRPSTNNRLFLSLRSGIPTEVDYALEELVHLTHAGRINLSDFPGSVEALLDLVEGWVEDVERESAASAVGFQTSGDTEATVSAFGSRSSTTVLGLGIDQPTVDRERRATDALLVLRNAVFAGEDVENATAKQNKQVVIWTIPGVPIHGLLRATMKRPEPMLYMLDLLIALFPSLVSLLEEAEAPTLPELFLTTGDVGFIVPLDQLFTLVPAHYLPSARLIPKLISFLLLTPALLTNSLNLLYHITQEVTTSMSVLKDPEIVNYLRILTRLVKWDARELSLALKHAGQVGTYIESPEPGALKLQAVDKKDAYGKHYTSQQTIGVALKQDDGKDDTGESVGLGPVVKMSDERRRRIRSMKEPERAHAWMADTFVSQPDSSVTQVVFWRAYNAFVQQSPDEQPIPPGGTAGDVIKSATTVFPAANAMVINKDDDGQPLPTNVFVIAGMRFKRSRVHTFACRWEGCANAQNYRSPEELYAHLKSEHGTEIASPCRWQACRSKSSSPAHLGTHVPPPIRPEREPKIKRVLIHPESSAESVKSAFVTYRPPPILPREYSLHYTGIMSPVDVKGQPASDAFFASLVLRNLGKALRTDTERVENEQDAEDAEGGRRARKRRKMEREGAFGLPAPPGLLDADLAIADPANGSGNARLSPIERTRARDAFGGVVEKTVLEILGMEGAIAAKLLDCVGF
ncbi:hypothetical protein FFLO_00358 [Filobasidium floriforme]|uniref:RFX-type winged-helix domain-containing protein n=1 Tax=Filobasidium floriforme TaxID=5210 RepID=A0A8K0JSI3_9TREE|nr:uncharacterized protein HD553DRAFT_266975 [Filobasidium floriforme]KAG7575368.1 hypothetical protein FFLO_00358 [Filobasidium floriforme]KAH8089543.1 hypothetical protein HD553DRAFT_266975 [Filobasidium floriforme]